MGITGHEEHQPNTRPTNENHQNNTQTTTNGTLQALLHPKQLPYVISLDLLETILLAKSQKLH